MVSRKWPTPLPAQHAERLSLVAHVECAARVGDLLAVAPRVTESHVRPEVDRQPCGVLRTPKSFGVVLVLPFRRERSVARVDLHYGPDSTGVLIVG